MNENTSTGSLTRLGTLVPWAMAGFFYAALVAIVFSDVLSGERSFIGHPDDVIQNFAWMTKIVRATHDGELPLWSFGTLDGVSFIGELQTAAFYPINLLFSLWARPGDVHQIDLLLLFHLWLAALGTHLLARSFGLSHAAAMVGAIIFSVTGTLPARAVGQINVFAGLVYMPWGAAFAVRAFGAPRPLRALAWSAALGLSCAMALLAGHTIGPLLLIIMCLIAVMADRLVAHASLRVIARRAVMVGAAAGGTMLAAAAPQILAMVEYFSRSYKWYDAGVTRYPHTVPYVGYVLHALHLKDLTSFLNGGDLDTLDGGTLFATHVGAFLVVAGLLLSVRHRQVPAALAAGLGAVLLGLLVGLTASTMFGRVLYHFPPFILVREASRWHFLSSLGMALAASAGAAIMMERLAMLRRDSAEMAGIALVALTMGQACIAPKRSLPVPPAPYPLNSAFNNPLTATLLSVMGKDAALYRVYFHDDGIPANIGDMLPLLTTDGHRSSRPVAFNDSFSWDPHSTENDERGVRWWVSEKPIDGLPELAQVGNSFIYERPSASPVFWLAGDKDARSELPLASVAWSTNGVTVHFAKPVAGTIVFAQPVYPGWHALAGNLSVPMTDIRGMMAAQLDAPREILTFRYAPAWLTPSCLLALAAWLGTAALTFAAIRRGS